MVNDDLYAAGYRDGKSSGHADWRIALEEVLPDDVERSPSSVAAYIDGLQG